MSPETATLLSGQDHARWDEQVLIREGGAGDGTRTRDILLGKQTLYRLSYSRPGVARQ
jgi:hypothetical protein